MRSLGLLTAAAITAALLMAVTANASTDQGVTATQHQVASLRAGINWHRSMTWRYQDRAGVPRTRSVHAERHTRSLPYLTWINHLWLSRQIRARHLAARVPAIAHLALWQCIHRGEGAWNDQGAPYYGGLQMTYGWDGLVGDAGNLSPMQQMAAAETGYQREIREKGYAYAKYTWIPGQWPVSHIPCMAYA